MTFDDRFLRSIGIVPVDFGGVGEEIQPTAVDPHAWAFVGCDVAKTGSEVTAVTVSGWGGPSFTFVVNEKGKLPDSRTGRV